MRRRRRQRGGLPPGVGAAIANLGLLAVDGIIRLIQYYKKKKQNKIVKQLTGQYEKYLKAQNPEDIYHYFTRTKPKQLKKSKLDKQYEKYLRTYNTAAMYTDMG